MNAAERLQHTLSCCLCNDETSKAVLEEIEKIGNYHDDGSFVIYGDDRDLELSD